MTNIKRGKLTRSDKKVAIRDEKAVHKQAKMLIKETKKDMFNPARMSVRHIDSHLHDIDVMLVQLQKLQGHTKTAHLAYHNVRAKKAELHTLKKHLTYAKKAKHLGAKNAQIANALKSDHLKKTSKIRSLIKRLKER